MSPTVGLPATAHKSSLLCDVHHSSAGKPVDLIRCSSNSNAGNYTGLSSLPDHYTERSRCLSDFRDMYGGELTLPYATFIIENMMPAPAPKRNRTYLSRYHNLTRNASRTFFRRAHNITKSKSFNVSEQQRLYESFLAQRKQNYSRARSNTYSHRSRSSNMTQVQQQYHNARQVPIQSQQSRYLNATQFRRTNQQSHQKPLQGEQWRSLNGTQLQRQYHKPRLEPKHVGGQSRNSVSKR